VQRDAGRQSQRAGAAPQHEEHLHGDDQQPGLWGKTNQYRYYVS
jgi:hypothetical protein